MDQLDPASYVATGRICDVATFIRRALPAAAYRLLTGRPFVLDCHTGAYLNPRWKRLQWLQHWLGRKAATNIVTNMHLAELVRQHGGKATLVPDVPVIYRAGEDFDVGDRFSVAAVCSFNTDEPVQELFEAARLLPDISFFVTGNTKHLEHRLTADLPANIQLTGFISDDAYGSLISRASVVVALTTQDHTCSRAGKRFTRPRR